MGSVQLSAVSRVLNFEGWTGTKCFTRTHRHTHTHTLESQDTTERDGRNVNSGTTSFFAQPTRTEESYSCEWEERVLLSPSSFFLPLLYMFLWSIYFSLVLLQTVSENDLPVSIHTHCDVVFPSIFYISHNTSFLALIFPFPSSSIKTRNIGSIDAWMFPHVYMYYRSSILFFFFFSLPVFSSVRSFLV